MAGAGGAPVVDAGPGAVHVVHGLLDGGELFVCLRQVGGEPLEGDLPQPEAGIPYGRSLRVPVTWDPSLDVEALLFVVSGGLSGRSCNELIEVTRPSLPGAADAGTADAGTAVFPVEPLEPRSAGSARFSPGLLSAGAHYALVTAGCTGPAASEDVCGTADPLFGSSQTLALAELDREIVAGEGSFGLQFLNASRTVARADVVLQGELERDARRLTDDVEFGAIRPPDAVPANEPLGIELHVEGSVPSSYTQAWSDTLAAAGDLVVTAGDNYLLVYVGPVPGSMAEPLAPPRFVLVHGG
jgi:hypothetical protein